MTQIFKIRAFIGVPIMLIVITIVCISVYFQFVYTADANPTAKPPAMSVDITVIKQQPIRLWKNFSGHLTAVDYVEIRPQASGIITEVKFVDGQLVNKGDILYVIDPRPLNAALSRAKADLITATNRFTLAKKEYKRSNNLVNTNLISESIYDERMNTKLVAESNVKNAQAQLIEAEINLSYAYVKAPVSGRVSRAEITLGNLVAAGSNAPLLTTIVSSESIYADFDIDEQTYLYYMQNRSTNNPHSAIFPVELRLEGKEQVYQGKIHVFDNRINFASGTIRARAIFDNPQAKLLPGMYARLRLGTATEENRILLTERAIGTDQNRKYVYIVNAENKTIYREVQLGDSIDGVRIVNSGLKQGDKVIVRGLMRIRPNMLVEPKEFSTVKSAAS